MRENFFKFPSTPHLTLLGDVEVRNDKVMSEPERYAFLKHDLVIEEKVDGANLGISFDSDGNIRAQNRGAYLSFPGLGQWKKLSEWLSSKVDTLFDHLFDRYILFGEWCYAQHSVFYNRLPDWFLGFDVYDKQVGCFLSSDRRDVFFRKIGICETPLIARGYFKFSDMSTFLSQSRLGDEDAEGLYLRFDQDKWLVQRAKLVQPAFIQSVEQHWSRSHIKMNRLTSEVHV